VGREKGWHYGNALRAGSTDDAGRAHPDAVPAPRCGRKLIITPGGAAAPARKPSRDETLVKALVRAHRWRRKIESGRARSITDLAEHERVTVAFVCRLLPLTCLAPDILGGDPRRVAAEGAEAGGDAEGWAADLERSAGEVRLQRLTRPAQGMRSTAIIR
jgi:hypothetical protein